MPQRSAWRLVGGGLAGMAVAVALSMVVAAPYIVVPLLVAVLCGIAFLVGIGGLAEKVWLLVPAFVIGVFGPFLLGTHGHDALMAHFGRAETCEIERTMENRGSKQPSVDHLVNCPSAGRLELRLPYRGRIKQQEATVLHLSVLRPVFADRTAHSELLLLTVPTGAFVLAMTAAIVRRRRVMRQS